MLQEQTYRSCLYVMDILKLAVGGSVRSGWHRVSRCGKMLVVMSHRSLAKELQQRHDMNIVD